jgi:hypothetical protein
MAASVQIRDRELNPSHEDRIYPESHKFSNEFWQPLELSAVVTHLEDEILPFNVPTFAKAEPEGCRQLGTGRGRGGEPADSIDLPHLLLLRFRGDRRKNHAETENDREPDQPHGHLGEGWVAEV